MLDLRYRVSTFREAGLEAKWDKTRSGQPYIRVRALHPEGEHEKEWMIVNNAVFDAMKRDGVLQGYKFYSLLMDIFSIPVRS